MEGFSHKEIFRDMVTQYVMSHFKAVDKRG